jgi:hypothetical protein
MEIVKRLQGDLNTTRPAPHVQCITNMSQMTHAMVPSISAPPRRTCMAPQPLPYLSSVIVPCARSQLGNLNHARGETTINVALTTITTATMAAIALPTIWSISITKHSHKTYINGLCLTPLLLHSRLLPLHPPLRSGSPADDNLWAETRPGWRFCFHREENGKPAT